MKRRNVLYLIRSWAFGGSHTILLMLMQHLPKEKYNIICVPYDTFSGLDEIFIEQARKRGLPPSDERIPWKSRGNWWKARAKVLELVKKYDIDLIHTHDPHSNTMLGIGRGEFPCAVVASAYGWWDGFFPFRRFVYQWIERDFALQHVDRVITVSNHMKQRILKGPTPESKIRVIETGIEAQEGGAARREGEAQREGEAPSEPVQSKRAAIRDRFNIPADAIVVGTVSRVSVEKGHCHLIDAMTHLSATHRAVRGLIVGNGPAKSALEEQVSRLQLTEFVKFTGFWDDLPGALAAMDIFAQPSVQQEGLPTSVLEAQAHGLPVVASDIGGTSEALVDGTTGLLVKPGDPNALATAIASLAANPDRRRAMGTAGRERIARDFTIERMVQRVASVYDEAMDDYEAQHTRPR